jgi:peptide/nickel transport system permease protein
VVRRELWPNVLDVLLVEFAMRSSWMVLAVSGLSFLGFGVNPPTPDWGLMINENRSTMALGPWATLFPILAIGTLVVALNLVADGIAKAVGLDRSRGAPT